MRSPSLAAVLSTVLFVSACAQLPTTPVGQTDVSARPAEKALLSGIRFYDDGQYAEAEKQLHAALRLNLTSSKDRAAAHKYLAFIYCTSSRHSQCEASFRAAMQADPTFALSKSEAGHPLWGPVYKRVHP
jgi:Tfp pilus assembly protein PilF